MQKFVYYINYLFIIIFYAKFYVNAIKKALSPSTYDTLKRCFGSWLVL